MSPNREKRTNIVFRINVIILCTALATGVVVFAITYGLLRQTFENDIKERAVKVNENAQSIINRDGFYRLNPL